MNTRLLILKISTLTILFFGYDNLVKAQKDTIPPVISKCNDTFKIQIGSVWIMQFFPITDNQSDSAHIAVVRTWAFTGPVNSLIRKVYINTIEATDSNGNKSQCNIYYKVDDYIPPVIYLKTTDTVCHIIGTPYNAVQPEVQDNYYLSNQVSIVLLSSNVNPNVAGIYEEKYQAIDPSSNVVYKTRYVFVSPDCATASVNKYLVEPFIIRPIPASDFILIDLMGFDKSLKIEIFSMNGKLVFESAFTSQLKIDTVNFSDGVYIVVLSGSNLICRQKIVIKH